MASIRSSFPMVYHTGIRRGHVSSRAMMISTGGHRDDQCFDTQQIASFEIPTIVVWSLTSTWESSDRSSGTQEGID